MEKVAAKLAEYIFEACGCALRCEPEETRLYELLLEFAAEIKRSAIEP